MMRRAIIVGCNGQDGRLLSDLLFRQGCQTIGIARERIYSEATIRRKSINIEDQDAVSALIGRFKPNEVYYLPAFHHASEDRLPDTVALFQKGWAVHAQGLVHFLEAIRRLSPKTRLLYAASCRVFGSPSTAMQDESTPLDPDDAYGITKAAGVMTCRMYRRRHGVFASVAILYNHESSLRRSSFVSRKIILGALAVRAGRRDHVSLGSLATKVDWGYAPDYVEAMQRIVRHRRPDDFIVSSGKNHSVREFVRVVSRRLGLDWRKCFREDLLLLREKAPSLVGNPAKLMRQTGWRPTVDFEQMIDALLSAELGAAEPSSTEGKVAGISMQ